VELPVVEGSADEVSTFRTFPLALVQRRHVHELLDELATETLTIANLVELVVVVAP
jgi:hypothetical protein